MHEKNRELLLGCPACGRAALIRECPAQCFAQGMAGSGAVLFPTEKTFLAPANVKIVAQIGFHAVGMMTEEGLELLLHVGLGADHPSERRCSFCVHTGETVRRGMPLLQIEPSAAESGVLPATAFLLCNLTRLRCSCELLRTGFVTAGSDLIRVTF